MVRNGAHDARNGAHDEPEWVLRWAGMVLTMARNTQRVGEACWLRLTGGMDGRSEVVFALTSRARWKTRRTPVCQRFS